MLKDVADENHPVKSETEVVEKGVIDGEEEEAREQEVPEDVLDRVDEDMVIKQEVELDGPGPGSVKYEEGPELEGVGDEDYIDDYDDGDGLPEDFDVLPPPPKKKQKGNKKKHKAEIDDGEVSLFQTFAFRKIFIFEISLSAIDQLYLY